jgi:hypothetical protein
MYVLGAVYYYNRDNDCTEATKILFLRGRHYSLPSRISIISLYGIWGHPRFTFIDVVNPIYF